MEENDDSSFVMVFFQLFGNDAEDAAVNKDNVEVLSQPAYLLDFLWGQTKMIVKWKIHGST